MTVLLTRTETIRDLFKTSLQHFGDPLVIKHSALHVQEGSCSNGNYWVKLTVRSKRSDCSALRWLFASLKPSGSSQHWAHISLFECRLKPLGRYILESQIFGYDCRHGYFRAD